MYFLNQGLNPVPLDLGSMFQHNKVRTLLQTVKFLCINCSRIIVKFCYKIWTLARQSHKFVSYNCLIQLKFINLPMAYNMHQYYKVQTYCNIYKDYFSCVLTFCDLFVNYYVSITDSLQISPNICTKEGKRMLMNSYAI